MAFGKRISALDDALSTIMKQFEEVEEAKKKLSN